MSKSTNAALEVHRFSELIRSFVYRQYLYASNTTKFQRRIGTKKKYVFRSLSDFLELHTIKASQ